MASDRDLLLQISTDIKDVETTLFRLLQQVISASQGTKDVAVQVDVSVMSATRSLDGLRQSTELVSQGLREMTGALKSAADAFGRFGDNGGEAGRKVAPLMDAILLLGALGDAISGLEAAGRAIAWVAAQARAAGGLVALLGARLGALALAAPYAIPIVLAITGWIVLEQRQNAARDRKIQEAIRQLQQGTPPVEIALSIMEPNTLRGEGAPILDEERLLEHDARLYQQAVDLVVEAQKRLRAATSGMESESVRAQQMTVDMQRAYEDAARKTGEALRREIEQLLRRAIIRRMSDAEQIAALRKLRQEFQRDADAVEQIDVLIAQLQDRMAARTRAAAAQAQAERDRAFQDHIQQLVAEGKAAEEAARQRVQAELAAVQQRRALGQASAQDELDAIQAILTLSQSSNEQIRSQYHLTKQERADLLRQAAQLEKQVADEAIALQERLRKSYEDTSRRRVQQLLAELDFRKSVSGLSPEDEIAAIDEVLDAQRADDSELRRMRRLSFEDERALLVRRAQLKQQIADRDKQYERDLLEFQIQIGEKSLQDRVDYLNKELEAAGGNKEKRLAILKEIAQTNAEIAQQEIDRLQSDTKLTKEEVKERLKALLTLYEGMGEKGALAAERVRAALAGLGGAAADSVRDVMVILTRKFNEWADTMYSLAQAVSQAAGQLIQDFADTSTSLFQDLLNFVGNVGKAILNMIAQLVAQTAFWALLMALTGGAVAPAMPPLFKMILGFLGVPGLQRGGIVTQPMLAMLHPPEAVIPLHSPRASAVLGGGETAALLREQNKLVKQLVAQRGVRFSDLRLDREARLRYGLAFSATGIR